MSELFHVIMGNTEYKITASSRDDALRKVFRKIMQDNVIDIFRIIFVILIVIVTVCLLGVVFILMKEVK